MRYSADRLSSETTERGTKDFRRFLGYLGGFLGLAAAAFLAMLLGLWLAGSLPAAPLTATYCIDEKFKFLAEQKPVDADLVAVGSSVTWRNLDLTPFVERGLAKRPVNAAPCYLFMDQAVFYTRFLLDHQRDVEAVVSIVAPRDFGYCAERERAFFDQERAGAYVFGGRSPLLIYATNFRPIRFLRDAMSVAEQRSRPDARRPLVMGPYGAGPIKGNTGWNPAPDYDPACFDALEAFEAMLTERGVRLVLVSFPPSPPWRAEHDPGGDVMRDFERRLNAALVNPDTIFISSDSLTVEDAEYVDAVHFRWRDAQRFSAVLADHLASIQPAAGAAGRTQITEGSR